MPGTVARITLMWANDEMRFRRRMKATSLCVLCTRWARRTS